MNNRNSETRGCFWDADMHRARTKRCPHRTPKYRKRFKHGPAAYHAGPVSCIHGGGGGRRRETERGGHLAVVSSRRGKRRDYLQARETKEPPARNESRRLSASSFRAHFPLCALLTPPAGRSAPEESPDSGRGGAGGDRRVMEGFPLARESR